MKNFVNVDGYVSRCRGAVAHGGRRRAASREWYLGKRTLNVTINTLPQRYWGKHIRIRIEVL